MEVNEKKDNTQNKLNFLSWEDAKNEAKKYLQDFTLKEKISLMYGSALNPMKRCVGQIEPIAYGFFNKKVKFAGIKFGDGPTGPRFQKGLTNSWPAPINLASTFNRELIYEVGKAQGYDFYHTGINIALTPCINLCRVPQGGRIFEGYGENPFLTGELCVELIKGIQSNGVIACAKHFIGNEQEKYRIASNSIIDERTLMEIYAEPFYKAIKKGDVGCIMCSYNAVNGTLLFKNKLMKEILKEKFGFNGFIISDWYAVNDDSPDSVNNGLDINMPGTINKLPVISNSLINPSFWSKLPNYVEQNLIKEEKINEAAERIISTMFKFDQIKYFPKNEYYSQNFITEESKKLNRKVAAESNILLKNENNILPIDLKKIEEQNKKYKIALLGIDAFKGNFYGQEPSFSNYITSSKIKADGHLTNGYGSGTTTYNYVVVPYDGIKSKINNCKNIELVPYAKLDKEENEDIETSKKIAETCDLVLIFVHSISGEGCLRIANSYGDRSDLDVLHNGNKLIEEISQINQNVIVIINSPGPVNMDWKDKVKGIIFGGLAGPESGNGIADVLFGDVNPSGHLPFVIGKKEQYPSEIKGIQEYDLLGSLKNFKVVEFKDTVKYDEGLFIGQYWFDKKDEIPTYYFGYGLSYTQFEFSDLICNYDKSLKKLTAKFKVKNIGNYDGSAVAFLYLTFPSEVENYPVRVLKGFDKYLLKINEIKECSIDVEEHDLSYYDINSKDYILPKKGNYKVFVGQSSNIKDLTLTQEVSIE